MSASGSPPPLPSVDDIERAAAVIRRGGLVGVPTETVYGLAADATSDAAVARIYAAKRRPTFNPLIAHVADRAAADAQAHFTPAARRLADAFWPGPLTLVVRARTDASVCLSARAGLGSVALRWPDHPTMQALIAAAGRPLAAPSANRSGRVSPVSAAHVRDDLGPDVDVVLDSGLCRIGLESTIVACLDGAVRLLRPGGLSRARIEDVLGTELVGVDATEIIAPGALRSHYAPNAPLRLGSVDYGKGEAVLDFGGQMPNAPCRLDLSPTGDLTEAGHNLFAYLRQLDEAKPQIIVVAPIPSTGLGEALNDRLQRAAAPRTGEDGTPRERGMPS